MTGRSRRLTGAGTWQTCWVHAACPGHGLQDGLVGLVCRTEDWLCVQFNDGLRWHDQDGLRCCCRDALGGDCSTDLVATEGCLDDSRRVVLLPCRPFLQVRLPLMVGCLDVGMGLRLLDLKDVHRLQISSCRRSCHVGVPGVVHRAAILSSCWVHLHLLCVVLL